MNKNKKTALESIADEMEHLKQKIAEGMTVLVDPAPSQFPVDCIADRINKKAKGKGRGKDKIEIK